ncbi:MAG: ABC transporter permease [Bryobacteraceae bacterium]|jgi:predicted permease
MRRDLSFSFRTLRRSPMFAAVAILSLALGIGANTAIFSLVDQVILRLLPARDPQQLVVLHRNYSLNGSDSSDNYESVFSYSMYRAIRDHDAAFSGVIARCGGQVTVLYQGNAESADAEIVSGNLFQVLGVGAAAGRVFAPDDDSTPAAQPVTVLSHGYWLKRFAGSRAVVGQTIQVNGYPTTVIGVAAAPFDGVFSGNEPQVYLPLMMQRIFKPTWKALDDPQFRWLTIMARLAPGTSIARAQAPTDAAHRIGVELELAKQHASGAAANPAKYRLEIRPAPQGINEFRRDQQTPLLALMAMAGLTLLIACANVASLTVARATARRREMSIRIAIGATRWNLVRQLLVEGVMLAAAGGALGLVVADWSTKALLHALPQDFAGDWLKTGLNLRLLAFACGLSLVSGVLFALAPALQSTRHNLVDALRAGAAASVGRAVWFRKCVVAAQVALSLVLVVGAGLFSGTLYNLAKVNLGFRTERLMTFKVDAARNRPLVADAVAFYRALEVRLAAIPGVTGVAASGSGPFSNSNSSGNITMEGYQPKNGEDVDVGMSAVNPGFFAGLGIPLRAGREFTERDGAGAPKAVVVNEAFAKLYCAGRNPVGLHLMFGGGNHPTLDREIVGLASDVRKNVREPAKPALYYPYTQWKQPERLMYYVRAAGVETALGPAIRAAVRDEDPNVPVAVLQPITVRIDDTIYSERLLAMLSTAFGALATLLAAIGLYGVVAYAVTRRTAEIGVRMALGALPGDVLRMVLAEAGKLALAGIVVGLAAALALSRLVQAQLFGVQAADPRILIGAAAFLAAVAMGAAFLPGRRASRISPVQALKYE